MDEIRSFIIVELDKIGDLEESEQIGEIVERVKERYNTQYKYFHAGGFDSPGYDIECYIIALIDENGELQGVDVSIESC